MRPESLAALAILSTVSSQAFALDDCNKHQQIGELELRLECLNKNNAELSAEIIALKNTLQGLVRYNDHVTLQISQADGSWCLSGDRTGAGFLRQCQPNGESAASYSIRKLP